MAKAPRLTIVSRRRRALWGAGVGLVVALLLGGARDSSVIDDLELGLVDLRTRHFAGDRDPDPRIVLAQVMEHDVAAVQQTLGYAWPWDLEINAAIFQVMAEAGVQAVMVDVLHLDRGAGPDDVPDAAALTPVIRAQREAEASSAETYGAALRAVGRTALAFELHATPEYEVAARVASVEGRLGAVDLPVPSAALRRPGANLPVRRVLEGGARLGFSNVDPDPDGVVRRAPVVGRWGDRSVLSLALATAELTAERDVGLDDHGVRLGDTSQRLMPDASFLVNFHGVAHATYPRVAPSQILSWAQAKRRDGTLPEAARRALEGKIVVWGVNLAGRKDVVTSPISAVLDGAEYQATILDNLLHGDGRVHASRGLNLLLLSCLTLFLGVVGGISRGGPRPHVLALLLLVVFVASAFVVFGRGTSIDLLTPVLGVFLTWGGTLGLRLVTEGRRNRWLEGTFGRYLAPSIIDALKRDPSLLELGGRRRHITILFSDVAGFTRISESLEPEQLVSLLNRYLTDHSAAVMAEGGVVDKFEGDAVMAFFGDPVPQEDHALRACRAALVVQAGIAQLRPYCEELGLADFSVRIGINTGDAVVGNMGSRQRFDYTCMGDAVNLASRLEGANKAFGSRILLGPLTYEAVKDDVVARPVAGVVVVGKTEPVAVYELLGLSSDAPLAEHVAAFRRAQEAARRGDPQAARAALAEAESLLPGEAVVAWCGDAHRQVAPPRWRAIAPARGAAGEAAARERARSPPAGASRASDRSRPRGSACRTRPPDRVRRGSPPRGLRPRPFPPARSRGASRPRTGARTRGSR
ncbi:MAG: CHASE2 domain-containing protein [Planctomycetota bacterium]|jgi:adenylate cyclase